MYAGDEFYPDDVTSGLVPGTPEWTDMALNGRDQNGAGYGWDIQPEPDACPVIVEGDWERDHWTPVLCGKPATDGDDRCAEHALA
jgi:hypothetical protein